MKKLSDTPGMVEKWEADMRRLEAEYGEKLSDGLKCGILLEMVPIQIGEFITQRVLDEDTYEDTKETVLRYVETKADFGPTPMDLDALKGDEESSGDWGQEGAPQGQGQEDLWGLGEKGIRAWAERKEEEERVDSKACAIHAVSGDTGQLNVPGNSRRNKPAITAARRATF